MIKSDEMLTKGSPVSSLPILGTYEGECADASITNENGLDITYDVWANTFDSDLYKRALKHGWYIGFLGHPEDPNCMDFEHACIVLTECHIESDGKVYGKFNLIDTPVGRIVSAFQDAGVKFGISVRGAGDIINNSVDPDTFVFRGFDLVTFPAFPESIPEFTKIAASSDAEKQSKYKAVCAAVKKNLDGLNTVEAVDIVQSCFAAQSPEYAMLQDRKNGLTASTNEPVERSDRVMGMLNLYFDVIDANKKLQKENKKLRSQIAANTRTYERKVKSMKKIMANQLSELNNELTDITASYQVSKSNNKKIKSELSSVHEQNLKYKQRISASMADIQQKDSVISGLRSELSETVSASSQVEKRMSNLDTANKRLVTDITAANALIRLYQDAYAKLYADVVGCSAENITITATTSPDELRNIIGNSSSYGVTECVTDDSDIVDEDDSGLVTC